jgi:hypothetical protein
MQWDRYYIGDGGHWYHESNYGSGPPFAAETFLTSLADEGIVLTTRAKNVLRQSMRAGGPVKNKSDILAIGRAEFLCLPNCGRKTVTEIGRIIGEDW